MTAKFAPGDTVLVHDYEGEKHIALLKRVHGLIECEGGDDCSESHMMLAATWPVSCPGADLGYGEHIWPIGNSFDRVTLIERAV